MNSEISVELLPMLGVCNLCLSEGVVKSMIIMYNNKGTPENYSEMLQKCFSIDITILELGDTKRLICNMCIEKLRTAVEFRRQVDVSIKTLQENFININELKEEDLTVDEHNILYDDTGTSDIHGDDDNDPDYVDDLMNLEIKIEPEEIKTDTLKKSVRLRKRNTSKEVSKKKNLKFLPIAPKQMLPSELDCLIKNELFPFKIRKKSFNCGVCNESTDELESLKTHTLQHDKKLLASAFRKMIYFSSRSFYRYKNKFRCKLCGADIENFMELKTHIETCGRIESIEKWSALPFKLEKDQLDCHICKKKFINFVSLNTHMNVHYPNYICENCGKAFASKARLSGHIRTHEIGEFPCKYCDKVFDKITKRENHVSKEHKAGVRYACKRCNISLTSFYARQKHLAEVHNEELKRYKCKSCPQSYITPGHLSSHVRRDHLNERNHKCSHCDMAFYTKNSLKMHMIKHDGERIHVCPVCQKSYQRKKTLREHLRIHNNDKRFVCPVCGRAFTQKCTLKGHLKVHDRKVDSDDRLS